jgi:hypothetical protein
VSAPVGRCRGAGVGERKERVMKGDWIRRKARANTRRNRHKRVAADFHYRCVMRRRLLMAAVRKMGLSFRNAATAISDFRFKSQTKG